MMIMVVLRVPANYRWRFRRGLGCHNLCTVARLLCDRTGEENLSIIEINLDANSPRKGTTDEESNAGGDEGSDSC